MMEAFKSARLFNPGKVTDFKPTAVTLEACPFFGIGGSLLSSLKSELPIPRWHIDPLI